MEAEARSTSEAPDDRWEEEGSFDPWAESHRVTVWLRLGDPELLEPREQSRVYALEDRLMRALHDSGVGDHDTNALERGFLAVRLVGEDADAIVAVVTPLLGDAAPGSYLAIRRGPAGTGEDRLDLPT